MASELTGSYNPSEVVVTVGGVIMSGWSDGDHITARRNEDVSTMRAGNDGGVGRAINPNKSGEFEFKLLQTSGVNDLLSALVNADDLVNGGKSQFPIAVVDGSGRSLAVATACWVKSLPELTLGKEVGERTWVFSAADLRLFVGGN
jgi:hypothetical protein